MADFLKTAGGIWLVAALILVPASAVIAYLRGARPFPWAVGALLFPPLVLWVMMMPLPKRGVS